MRLIPNARRVAKRAWTIRLGLLIALLEGLNQAVLAVGYALPIPPMALGILITVLGLLTAAARLIPQKGITDASQ